MTRARVLLLVGVVLAAFAAAVVVFVSSREESPLGPQVDPTDRVDDAGADNASDIWRAASGARFRLQPSGDFKLVLPDRAYLAQSRSGWLKFGRPKPADRAVLPLTGEQKIRLRQFLIYVTDASGTIKDVWLVSTGGPELQWRVGKAGVELAWDPAELGPWSIQRQGKTLASDIDGSYIDRTPLRSSAWYWIKNEAATDPEGDATPTGETPMSYGVAPPAYDSAQIGLHIDDIERGAAPTLDSKRPHA